MKITYAIGSLFGLFILHLTLKSTTKQKIKTSWKQVQLTSHLWNTLDPKIQRLDLHKYGSLRLKASRFSPTCIRITLSWRDDSFEQDEKHLTHKYLNNAWHQ